MEVFFFPKGPYLLLISVKSLHKTFPWSHIPVDERWSLGSCRLPLGCSKSKQSSSNMRPAARRWWLVLTSRWQVAARPHEKHARDDDRMCSSELGLVSKHTAAIKAMGFAAVASTQPAQTLILQSVNIPLQSYYLCLPVYLNWTRIWSQMGRLICALVLFIYFFNSG